MAEDIKTKRCSGSPKWEIPPHDNVPLSEFSKDNSRKDGLRNSCKKCRAAAERAQLTAPEGRAKHAARLRAWRATPKGRAVTLIHHCVRADAKKNLKCDLSDHCEEITDILKRGVCQLSGLSFDFSKGPPKPNSPSIDRIDTTKAHNWGNVQVICWALNCLFQQWGEEASIPIVQAWIKRSKSPLVAA
jgi:hypothetical protein